MYVKIVCPHCGKVHTAFRHIYMANKLTTFKIKCECGYPIVERIKLKDKRSQRSYYNDAFETY